jgi:hypothetical protein
MPITLICNNKCKQLQLFLPAFALASFLMLYECNIQLWVRMSMGAHPISYECILPSLPRSVSMYKNILTLIERVGVLLVETSARTFRLRMNLPTIFTNHFVSTLVPKFASVGFDGDTKRVYGDSSLDILSVHDQTKELLFQYLIRSVQFLVLFLSSPITQIMSFLKLYSNNIIFSEAESMKKYKKSIECDPLAPYTIVEKVKSNDYTIVQREESASGPSSSIHVMRVLGAFFYAYELLHKAFNVAITDDSILDPVATDIIELKAPILSAAARILIWIDGVTHDRHRLKPEWLLPTVMDANLLSFYGSYLIRKEVKVNVKSEDLNKRRKSGKPSIRSTVMTKFYEVLGVGPFSPGYRTVPREEIHTAFINYDYSSIEKAVCKSYVSEGKFPFQTHVPTRAVS